VTVRFVFEAKTNPRPFIRGLSFLHTMGDGDLEDQLSEQKEIKVKIPMELYLKLHQNKIINGMQIKDVVQDALDGYLGEIETEEDG